MPMLPGGTSLINVGYINSITSEINSIDVCSDLQAIVAKIYATFQAYITELETQLGELIAKTIAPTNLPSVITWIQNHINQYLVAIANTVATITAVVQAFTALAAAVVAAAARFEQCVVSLPTLVVNTALIQSVTAPAGSTQPAS